MEEIIKRIAKYILDNKFPGFEDVLVTKEQIAPSRFHHENNLVYNIFLVINYIKIKSFKKTSPAGFYCIRIYQILVVQIGYKTSVDRI